MQKQSLENHAFKEIPKETRSDSKSFGKNHDVATVGKKLPAFRDFNIRKIKQF